MNPQLERALWHLAAIPWHRTFFLGFVLSMLFVAVSIRAAYRHDVLARPSERGSHTTATPRLGGAAAALAFFGILFSFYRWFDYGAESWMASLVVGGGYALVGGILDDVLELPPRWKFLFQFAAAASVVIFGFIPRSYLLADNYYVTLPFWLAAALVFLWIVFFMNAFNFMDGMDGQASLFALIACMGICIPLAVYRLYSNPLDILVIATLAGCIGGLFVFNHPGVNQENKTFMGDGGSQFIGFAIAIFTLRLDHSGAVVFPTIAALIILSPFLWDVVYTLARRSFRGENVLQAHRSHLYQRLLIAGWSHGRTLAVNVLLWLSCAGLAQMYAWAGRVGALRQRYLILGLVGATLILYTMIVLAVEAAAARKPQALASRS